VIRLIWGLDPRELVFDSRQKKRLSLLHTIHTCSQVQPASYPIDTGGYFPGGKVAGAWSWLGNFTYYSVCELLAQYFLSSTWPHCVAFKWEQGYFLHIYKGRNMVVQGYGLQIQLALSMGQSPTRKYDSCAFGQDTYCLFWNPMVHCRIHKVPLQAPILSQSKPISTFPIFILQDRF
jgi:hypothetical protein